MSGGGEPRRDFYWGGAADPARTLKGAGEKEGVGNIIKNKWIAGRKLQSRKARPSSEMGSLSAQISTGKFENVT